MYHLRVWRSGYRHKFGLGGLVEEGAKFEVRIGEGDHEKSVAIEGIRMISSCSDVVVSTTCMLSLAAS